MEVPLKTEQRRSQGTPMASAKNIQFQKAEVLPFPESVRHPIYTVKRFVPGRSRSLNAGMGISAAPLR
jgi:hypothetical protein